MATDPKKNELSDEQVDKIAGGLKEPIGGEDETTDSMRSETLHSENRAEGQPYSSE